MKASDASHKAEDKSVEGFWVVKGGAVAGKGVFADKAYKPRQLIMMGIGQPVLEALQTKKQQRYSFDVTRYKEIALEFTDDKRCNAFKYVNSGRRSGKVNVEILWYGVVPCLFARGATIRKGEEFLADYIVR